MEYSLERWAEILQEALTYFTGPAAISRVADLATKEIVLACHFLHRSVLFSETQETVYSTMGVVLFDAKSLMTVRV